MLLVRQYPWSSFAHTCNHVAGLTFLGVTIVQYRDKTSDTGVLISTAKKLHEKCKAHGIPLLINDRVDVALAVGCEGVHLGQDDMNVVEARRILGEGRIIGATVSSIEEARIAVSHSPLSNRTQSNSHLRLNEEQTT